MPTYLFKRLMLMIPTLIGILLLGFLLTHLAPGGPLERRLAELRQGGQGRAAQALAPATVAALRRQYGFDQSTAARLVTYLGRLGRFDLGVSSTYERPALAVVAERLPTSLALGLVALILSYTAAALVAMLMMRYRGRWPEVLLEVGVLAIAALPAFVLGLILLILFAGEAGWALFPIGFVASDDFAGITLLQKILDLLWHAVLPVTCYVAATFAFLSMLSRDSMAAEGAADYVRTAYAKGLGPWRVLFKHVLRNALVPLAGGFGGTLALFLGGSMMAESLFQIRGLGTLGLEAVLTRDLNLMMALTLVSSVILLVGNIFGDLMLVTIDPRVRLR